LVVNQQAETPGEKWPKNFSSSLAETPGDDPDRDETKVLRQE